MTAKQRPLGSEKIRRAYAFLVEVERNGQVFTREDLVLASGWTDKTTRANLSKKLGRYVSRVDGGYRCNGILDLREESFCRLFSKNVVLASDPHRPLLGAKVEELVQKARESVLAAVQHYNNPTAAFRSGNYIVLMIIGYTALFHAIFRAVIKAHKIPTPSPLYFRPDKVGSRAMYSLDFVDWMVERYHEDPDFFYKARLVAEGKSVPEPSPQSV